MKELNEIIPEVIETEKIIISSSKEYSKVIDYTKRLEDTHEKTVSENKIPDREIIKDISTAELAIDLSLAAQAKQLSYKLLKLEKFLSKIEDILYSDETIDSMSKADLLALYSQTRLMKADAFKTLKEIKEIVDFEKLEMEIVSKNATQENKDENITLNEILEKIINDENIIKLSKEIQKEEIERRKNEN